MKALSDILSGRRLQKKQILDDKTVFFVFKKVIEAEFGQIGKTKFTPDYFAKRILFVKAQNSAWSAELWTNKARIIKKINEELGEEGVENIKMK
ncbi:MAG: DciA family protein [Candidatus Moranbacteria bacterium]|nr:DciA family protein [Candidatus Moranbacteria bacterium]